MVGLWSIMGGIMVICFIGFIVFVIKSCLPYDWASDFGSMWDRFAR